jgi:hypothetical protein
MSLRLVREGIPGGDVVIVYHSGAPDASLVSAAPDATIFVETFPALKGHYADPTPISDAVAAAGGSARRVILAGWSEGCQGIRAQLRRGEIPAACIAADGIHSTRPANIADHIDPWRAYRDRAIAGEVVLFVSHTAIVTPYLSTTETAELLETPGLHPTESIAGGETQSDGLFFLDAFPGTNADAHRFQGAVVLPDALRMVIAGAPPGGVRRGIRRRTKLIAGGLVAAAIGWLTYQLSR